MSETPEGYMPIIGYPKLGIRMDILNEAWAQRNHSQSLARLRERGGLSPCEALAIAEQRRWRSLGGSEAGKAAIELLASLPSLPTAGDEAREALRQIVECIDGGIIYVVRCDAAADNALDKARAVLANQSTTDMETKP